MENDYLDAANQMKTLIAQVSSERGADREKSLQRLNRYQSKGEDLIKQLNMEANSIAKVDIQERCKQRLKVYTNDFNDIKKQIKECKESAAKNGRDYLLGSEEPNSLMTSDDYKKRMEKSTQLLQSSGSTVDQSLSILVETEETAIETASRIGDQGRQIKNMRARGDEIRDEIQTGSRTINRMNRTRITNSIILIVVIIVLLGIIGVILYFVLNPVIQKLKNMFKSNSSSSSLLGSIL
jgi:hypothetical protein